MIKLDQNISLHNAKDEFLSEVKGFSNSVTPSTIESSFQQQRQRFERLKFTYLEQETRDKFLRIILNDEPHDLKDMEKGVEELKKRCSDLEDQMNLRQSDMDGLVEQLIKLNEVQTQKLTDLNGLITEIEGMETELSNHPQYRDVIDNVELTRYEEQFDSQFTPDDKVNDHESTDILTYLNNEHDNLVSQELQLNEINQELEAGKLKMNEKRQLVPQLEAKLAELSTLKNNNSNEFTALGNWLIRINRLLNSFATVSFNTYMKNDVLILNFDKYEIKLDNASLAVIETNINFNVDEYNSSRDKFRRLSEIIANTL